MDAKLAQTWDTVGADLQARVSAQVKEELQSGPVSTLQSQQLRREVQSSVAGEVRGQVAALDTKLEEQSARLVRTELDQRLQPQVARIHAV